MRSLSEYLESLIKGIFIKTGKLPIEIWLNPAQHPYLAGLNDRQQVGTFDLVQIYVSREIKLGLPEYFLVLDKPSQKIQFTEEASHV